MSVSRKWDLSECGWAMSHLGRPAWSGLARRLVGRKEHTVSLAWEISGREVGLGFWSFFSAAGNSKKQLDGDWSRTSVRHVGGGALCWARSENAGGSRLLQVVPYPSPLGESELWEAPQRRKWE